MLHSQSASFIRLALASLVIIVSISTMLTYAQFLCVILIHALLGIPSLVYISEDKVSASLAVVVPSSIQLLFLKLKEDLQLVITFMSIKEIQILKLEVKVENMEIKLEVSHHCNSYAICVIIVAGQE